MISTGEFDNHSKSICIAYADTIVGHAILDEVLHGRFRLSFHQIRAAYFAEQPEEYQPLSPTHQPDLSSVESAVFPSPQKYELVSFLQGIDCVCLVPPPQTRNRFKVMKTWIDACEEAGVVNVILMSMEHPEWVSRTTSPNLFEYRQIENHLKDSTIEHHCILRRSILYQELALVSSMSKQSGRLTLPINTAKLCPVDVADVARSAVSIFACKTPHGMGMCSSFKSSVHVLNGPKLYDGKDMAEVYQSIYNTNVDFFSNSRNEARQQFRRALKSVKNAVSQMEDLPTPPPRSPLTPEHTLCDPVVGHNSNYLEVPYAHHARKHSTCSVDEPFTESVNVQVDLLLEMMDALSRTDSIPPSNAIRRITQAEPLGFESALKQILV